MTAGGTLEDDQYQLIRTSTMQHSCIRKGELPQLCNVVEWFFTLVDNFTLHQASNKRMPECDDPPGDQSSHRFGIGTLSKQDNIITRCEHYPSHVLKFQALSKPRPQVLFQALFKHYPSCVLTFQALSKASLGNSCLLSVTWYWTESTAGAIYGV